MIRSTLAASLALAFLSTGVSAQAVESRPATGIRASIAAVQFDANPQTRWTPPLKLPREDTPQPSRTGRKIAGGLIGGVGGFFAGAWIGGTLDQNCNCDDPGWRGVLIGAPVGAIVGAITGVLIAR